MEQIFYLKINFINDRVRIKNRIIIFFKTMLKFKKKIILIAIIFFSFGVIVKTTQATIKNNIDDWYIKNFATQITVNKDASLDIKERIVADCGNALNKHGIFRIIPEEIKIKGGEKIKTPIKLLSITDFKGNKIKYTKIYNSNDKTITWKIGDPNKTVQRVNNYIIHYQVRNAVRFKNKSFDELYWNLVGTFWQLKIDNFQAFIKFPMEINSQNSQVEYYAGYLGENQKKLAHYFWNANNILEVRTTQPLQKKQGITLSVTFPKNIIKPYQPSFWEIYGKYFFLLIPLLVFFFCFYLWRKFGQEPHLNKTIIPEYEVPENLSPMEVGMLNKGGKFKQEFVTAEIINLAVKKLIIIKEIQKKVLFFKIKDYQFTKKANPQIEKELTEVQKIILKNIFQEKDEIKLSSLENSFYKCLHDIKKAGLDNLVKKKLLIKVKFKLDIILRILSTVIMFTSIVVVFILINSNYSDALLAFGSVFISGLTMFFFSFRLTHRTVQGAELNWKINGFKLFMKTVDKDRAQFYEKENMFEALLPMAIVFGITKLWIQRVKEIYGEEYFSQYSPVWFAGTLGSFNVDSFTSSIDNLSSAIALNTASSSSGSSGMGGAGGGSGGGGGGGW